MKAILIIADGMADRPVAALNGKTPLEAASKPFLNQIAKTGICGILDPIAPGIPPGSDTATLALLGYDALKVYTGRGALEALGSGVSVLPGDVAFRCNFATVDESMVVQDRRAGRIASEEAAKLAESLQKTDLKRLFKTKFLFKNTIQHRGVLLLRGPKLSAAVSDTDPGKNQEKVKESEPLDNTLEAELTAKMLNRLTQEFHKSLRNHIVNVKRAERGLPKANIVLCRGAGTLPHIQPLSKIYGVKAVGIGATPLVRGVCKAAGMKTLDVQGATGTPKTDYKAKAKTATRALNNCDFVLLHIKATDVASHDGN
ncbi:MAG: 2,3-bisphosphoglycerate-independent phosphoglycerate mutase, partial [Candidatus Bathyarchaeia archaeon]